MLEDCQNYMHYDEAAATQQLPVHSAGACADMGWPSMPHNSTGTAPCCSQQLLQQHLKQHRHHQHQHGMSLSSSFSAPSALQLEHTQQLSLGLVQPTHHLPHDLSTLLLCQQQHQPQQQQSHTALSLTRVSSSTADANSEGPGGSIPSSESTASQSPSLQLSTAQHNLRSSAQRRATAARPPQQPGSNSAAGPAAALHGVQASPLKKGNRSSTSVLFGGSRVNSTGCPSSTTSSSEALKELLRQAIARKQQQQASGDDSAAVRQRLLAALAATAAAQQRASTPQPLQQPGTRTAVETASRLLELVADKVSPVVASGMRQRLLQELRAISEDAAAAGAVFDVEVETRHVLPQLQAAAATAIRMQQAAAASAAALGGLTPSFGAQLQLPTTHACPAAAGTGVLAAAADDTDTPSGAQLAALLESTLSAAAASPAAVARSQGGSPACSGDAPSAGPTLRPNPAASASLLTTVAGQAGQGSAGGRAASPEAGSMQQLSLQDSGDLDADQARGSSKRRRVAASARGGRSGPKGSSAQPAPPSSSSWRQASPAPPAHLSSCASLSGVQDAGAEGPAAAAAAAGGGCLGFELEHLLQAELEAAMLEELGG